MDVCTAAKKKEADDEVGNPASFLRPAFPPTSDSLSPFGVSHSRGNAVKSLVRKRNEAEGRPFPSLFHPLFPSLSFHSREKLAHDAKFRDFIDRKVSPVPSVSQNFQKNCTPCYRARFMQTWNSFYTFGARAASERDVKLRKYTSNFSILPFYNFSYPFIREPVISEPNSANI